MLKEIKIELTNQCLRNCKHCSSSATNCIDNLKVLEFEDVSKIIQEAKRMNVETIVFTGGEPLMYDRLSDLIELTSKLLMKSTIYSFAYRTDETLEKYRKLIHLGLNKIIYSLADSLSVETDISTYDKASFFDKVFEDSHAKLGFHYTVSKDSFLSFDSIITDTVQIFHNKEYFDKIHLLRFVPHGKGSIDMDLSKNEFLAIQDFYLHFAYKNRIKLGTPWNILGIKNTPCIIADEIMIIGFDGIAYPCDSIKYFTKLGVSGSIKDHSLKELYYSDYFQSIRKLNTHKSCFSCKNTICKGGCIGQKIIANSFENEEKITVLKKCIHFKDPKCLK